MFRRILRLASQVKFQNPQQPNTNNNRFFIGIAATTALLTFTQSDFEQSLLLLPSNQLSQLVMSGARAPLCDNFSDKQLSGCIKKINEGIDKIKEKTPRYQPPEFKKGLRGTRYFIEFPIIGQNLDLFSLILAAEKEINFGKDNGALKKSSNSFILKDSLSYIIDYECNSSTAPGSKSKGSIYIRGAKNMNSQNGLDSFKFVLEKDVDFNDVDSKIMIAVLEEINKMQPPTQETKSRFNNKKQQQSEQKDDNKSITNQSGVSSEESPDAISVLENNGCSVFVPDVKKQKLDWDCLAGYEKVKRNIEDTVLLALTHGDVYDKITAATRMKNETNRPKCVLFEGPPGCGKTTSAKIISQQVNIPLIYMPLEAIMSKFYGESESRLAEIFEAAQSLGSVILFIDEIDSLATSRETGIHEATRRILSTLLRKIDSFESEGEVLVICATNRKKDLDPALISRTDMSIRFELPDAPTRAQIFQRYAKQLSKDELAKLGELSVNLSGRDISNICKDAERKWASKYIRKEVTSYSPAYQVYEESVTTRLVQIKDANIRMDFDYKINTQQFQQPVAFG